MEWLDSELIAGIVGIFGGIVILLFKLFNIPISSLNIFKGKGIKEEITNRKKSEILEEVEKLLSHESGKYISKVGRILTFSEVCKPSPSDFFDQYLKLWVSISRKTNTSYRKLTLDLTKVKIYNSMFVAHISGVILDVKRKNEIKLFILIQKDSRLYDIMGNFETIKEDSDSIEIKVLKDYHE